MSILKLRYAITGYLEVAVEGTATEKFINLSIRQGIGLWDIRHGVDRAVMKVDVDSFFDLRHLARKTGCRLRIVRKAGLPFFFSKVMRRRGLVAGVALFVILLYTLSSFVLFVRVEGNQSLEAEYILELAAESGVRPGIAKARIDKQDIAKQLVLAEPKIAWVGVHIRGTRVVIEVVESVQPQVDIDTPGHLIAAKDGLVYDVLVITGEARVKPGDTVTRGQVLVEGILHPQAQVVPEGEEEVEGSRDVPLRARGEVWARVWYEGLGEAALQEIERIPTGRYVSVWTLTVDGQPVLRVGRQNVPYADYEQETANNRILERILRFPVEIITETSYEVEHHIKKLTPKQALELAKERARVLAELQLPIGVAIENVTVENLQRNRDGFIGVRYVLETKENIAREQDSPGGE